MLIIQLIFSVVCTSVCVRLCQVELKDSENEQLMQCLDALKKELSAVSNELGRFSSRSSQLEQELRITLQDHLHWGAPVVVSMLGGGSFQCCVQCFSSRSSQLEHGKRVKTLFNNATEETQDRTNSRTTSREVGTKRKIVIQR